MYSPTIKLNKITLSKPNFAFDAALLKKKILFSSAILTVGGAMLLLFAVMWMPTLVVLDSVLTLALLISVFLSETAAPAPVMKKAAQFIGLAALGGLSAVLSAVVYTVLTFAL